MRRTYAICQLTAADIARFCDLLGIMGEAFDDRDTYTKAQPDTAYLSKLLDSPHFIALAALDGEAVIGGLAAYELMKFEQVRSEIYIYDLAVAATHRRRGVATALVDRVRAIGAARDADVVYVQAHRQDEPAIALYSKFASGEDVVHFDIAVK